MTLSIKELYTDETDQIHKAPNYEIFRIFFKTNFIFIKYNSSYMLLFFRTEYLEKNKNIQTSKYCRK